MRLTKRANITNGPDDPDACDASPVDKPRHASTESASTERFAVATAVKLLAVPVLALGLANCSSAPRPTRVATPAAPAKVDAKYGVKPSPRVVSEGKKVPKGGGRAMVGKPYTVAGRTFTPRESDDYVAVGTASWYGAAFHGRKTANGEVFDKHSFAAAHPTLPLPSYVRVTNLSNQRSMIVRVNDRGPFHGNRLIDLSKNAAEALDFHRQGTARVKVEYVGRASLGGSDDRKLLATLNTTAPAAVPALAPRPAPSIAPVPDVTPAPVMVASAEPVAPVAEIAAEPMPAAAAPAPVPAAEAVVAAAPEAAPAPEPVKPLISRTVLARPAAPLPPPAAEVEVQQPVAVAAAPQPLVAPPSRTLVAPQQTLAFAAPAQAAPAQAAPAGAGLTELVREVSEPQALAAAPVAIAPLPPSRPVEIGRRRSLLASPAMTEALPPPAAPAGRRALVASLNDGPAKRKDDAAGVYFEPMPLSQLTPQRFTAGGGGSGRQKADR